MFSAAHRTAPAAAPTDAGQRHRDRMARKSRAESARVAEIGPPPPRDEELWARYRLNLFLYLCEVFPETTGLSPLSLDHRRIIERTQAVMLHGGQELFIVYRGFAKSTISENAATWAAGYGHRKFFVPLASTDDMARVALDSIQFEFETNDRLLAIFPAACHAARALEGVEQRAGKQTINGRRTYIEWSTKRCILPTVDGFEGSGAIIWPKGITSNVRGLRFKRPDGEQARPDFILGDDLQTDASAASPQQCKKRLAALGKTILRLGGHRKKLAIVVNATVIEPDDMIDQLADRKKYPGWRTTKVPMLKSFSKAHETLWLAAYAEIRTSFNPDDDDDQARALREANAFYLAHRAEMDAGAEATWDSCFDPETEHSAIQHAYNILIDTGEDAFMAECQNAPQRDVAGLTLLTPDEICARQSDWPRYEIPPDCSLLTTFVDVHPGILYWQCWAWIQGMTGFLVDDGEFPKQPRKYFAHRSITRRLKNYFPNMNASETVKAGLNALLHGHSETNWPGLMRRELLRGDGTPLRVGFGGLDANGEHSDAVKHVIRFSPFASILVPTYGTGVGAKKAPISRWAQSRKQKGVGPEWILTEPNPGEPRGLLFDANFYKTKLHQGLALPRGSQGTIYLYKAPPTDHRLKADHWTSERPTEVRVGSRVVQEFAQKPNTDNHHLDVAVGNLVVATRAGIRFITAAPISAKRRPKRKAHYFDH